MAVITLTFNTKNMKDIDSEDEMLHYVRNMDEVLARELWSSLHELKMARSNHRLSEDYDAIMRLLDEGTKK